jgi:hypothetical protein
VALIGPEYVPAGIVVPLALQLAGGAVLVDAAGATDCVVGGAELDVDGAALNVDCALNVDALNVGCARDGDAAALDVDCALDVDRALDIDGAALDDETGLHAATLTAVTPAAMQIRPRRGTSVNFTLITPYGVSGRGTAPSMQELHRIAVTAQ